MVRSCLERHEIAAKSLSLLSEFASNIHPSIGHRLKVKNYPVYFASNKLPCGETILRAYVPQTKFDTMQFRRQKRS